MKFVFVFTSLLLPLIIMMIGLIINSSWFKKNDKDLFNYLINSFDIRCEGFGWIAFLISLLLIIFLIPIVNIIVSLSINIALFIAGGQPK